MLIPILPELWQLKALMLTLFYQLFLTNSTFALHFRAKIKWGNHAN